MVDMAAIAGAATALRSAYELSKAALGVRDEAMIRAKVIEMQAEISSALASAITAQTDQFAALDRVRELEKEVTELKAWDVEKSRYELKEVGPGAFARAVKPDARGSDPMHYICPTCYERGKKTPLQALSLVEQRRGGDIRTCSTCKTAVAFARNPDWARQP
jgi:hypothetical protein